MILDGMNSSEVIGVWGCSTETGVWHRKRAGEENTVRWTGNNSMSEETLKPTSDLQSISVIAYPNSCHNWLL